LPVPSKENEQSSACMLGISILLFSTIFRLDYGTVQAVWYFCFSSYFSNFDNYIATPTLIWEIRKDKWTGRWNSRS